VLTPILNSAGKFVFTGDNLLGAQVAAGCVMPRARHRMTVAQLVYAFACCLIRSVAPEKAAHHSAE
jgi:hypothetical protein